MPTPVPARIPGGADARTILDFLDSTVLWGGAATAAVSAGGGSFAASTPQQMFSNGTHTVNAVGARIIRRTSPVIVGATSPSFPFPIWTPRERGPVRLRYTWQCIVFPSVGNRVGLGIRQNQDTLAFLATAVGHELYYTAGGLLDARRRLTAAGPLVTGLYTGPVLTDADAFVMRWVLEELAAGLALRCEVNGVQAYQAADADLLVTSNGVGATPLPFGPAVGHDNLATGINLDTTEHRYTLEAIG